MVKKYRVSRLKSGQYEIESTTDGTTWKSTGSVFSSKKDAKKEVDSLNSNIPKSANGKSIITKDEADKAGINWMNLPTLYDLQRPNFSKGTVTDKNGYIDSEGRIHLNSLAVEDKLIKSKVKDNNAQEDLSNALDLIERARNGEPDQGVLQTANFTQKDANDNNSWSNEDLLALRKRAREEGNKELELEIQAEVNRRFNDGEAPEYAPKTKEPENLDEPSGEATLENTPDENLGNTNIGDNEIGDVAGGSEGNTGGDDVNRKEKGEGWKKFGEFWKNLAQKQKEWEIRTNQEWEIRKEQEQERKEQERKEQYKKFLSTTNPNLIKAVVPGSKSGLSLADRMAGLGEILATLTANTANGIYAGVNKTSFSPVQGRMSKIYNQAAQDSYTRSKEVLDTENKAKKDKANRLAIIDSSQILKDLSYDIKDFLADKLVTDMSDSDWKRIENDLNKRYNNTEMKDIIDAFKSLRKTFSDVTDQISTVVDINGKEFDLMRKPQEAILAIIQKIRELENQKLEVASLPFERLKDFMQSFKSTYSAIMNVSSTMEQTKDFGYDAGLTVKAGVPLLKVAGGEISGAVKGGKSSNESQGMQADQLALEGILEGKVTAEQWNKDTKKYRDAIISSIQLAIDEAYSQINTLRKFSKLEDGIVKAPHMKQWILREDGTRIALSPSDNIYATKNKLTTKKDNGQDIVPMEKEDRAVTIQKKLGYGGNGINKQFAYYLTKLK